MGAGYNYHFKTTTQLKITLFERLRDFVANGLLRVRSLDLIEEMKAVKREGDKIGTLSEKLKDDRVMAMALAVHCWEEKARRMLIQRRFTRDAEKAQKSTQVVDRINLFNQNHIQMFFAKKQTERNVVMRQARYNQWRHASGRRY